MIPTVQTEKGEKQMSKIKFYINKWIKGIQYRKFCKTYLRQEASCRDCPYNNGEEHFCDKYKYTGTENCCASEETE